MPLNEQKIIKIIVEQCETLPERCKGYRRAMLETVTDIIQAERQNKSQGTNIQQKVNDKCNALGRLLASKRGELASDGE